VHVPRGEPGTRQRTEAQVEVEKIVRDTVPAALAIASQDCQPERVAAQPRTLERQRGEIVQGIPKPQAAIEFQAIDDGNARCQTDMLGPQVAVTLEHMCAALVEPACIEANVAPLRRGDCLHE